MSEPKLLILMTSGPQNPRRCATPFHMAAIGAAMEWEVSMFFTIDGALLLKKGVAETVYPKAGGKPVSDFLQDAVGLGVRIYACTPSMELHDIQQDELIDGVAMAGGAAMLEMADEAKVVLTI